MNTQRGDPSLVIRKIRTKRASLEKVNSVNDTSVGECLMTNAFFYSVDEYIN